MNCKSSKKKVVYLEIQTVKTKQNDEKKRENNVRGTVTRTLQKPSKKKIIRLEET